MSRDKLVIKLHQSSRNLYFLRLELEHRHKLIPIYTETYEQAYHFNSKRKCKLLLQSINISPNIVEIISEITEHTK